jgi:PEP-CTERM motif
MSQNIPGFKNDPPLTSFTIAPGILVAGQSYLFQANYRTYTQINTTSFTGTGITGDPVGTPGYLTSTFITIDAIVPEPSTYVLLGLGGLALLILFRRESAR